jgi:hypothetical protein
VQAADLAAVAADMRACSVENHQLQHHVHVGHDAHQQQVPAPLNAASALALLFTRRRSASSKTIGLVNGISQVPLTLSFKLF